MAAFSLITDSLPLLRRSMRRHPGTWRNLSGLLSLLHHDLPLLHFLQHLLRSLHIRLIRTRRGLFLSFRLLRAFVGSDALTWCIAIHRLSGLVLLRTRRRVSGLRDRL